MHQNVLYYMLLLFLFILCLEEQCNKINVQYVSLRLLYFSWIYVL